MVDPHLEKLGGFDGDSNVRFGQQDSLLWAGVPVNRPPPEERRPDRTPTHEHTSAIGGKTGRHQTTCKRKESSGPRTPRRRSIHRLPHGGDRPTRRDTRRMCPHRPRRTSRPIRCRLVSSLPVRLDGDRDVPLASVSRKHVRINKKPRCQQRATGFSPGVSYGPEVPKTVVKPAINLCGRPIPVARPANRPTPRTHNLATRFATLRTRD